LPDVGALPLIFGAGDDDAIAAAVAQFDIVRDEF